MSPVIETIAPMVPIPARDDEGFPMRLRVGILAIFPMVMAPEDIVAPLEAPIVQIQETSPVMEADAPTVAGVVLPPDRLPMRHPPGIVANFARAIDPEGIVAAADPPMEPT